MGIEQVTDLAALADYWEDEAKAWDDFVYTEISRLSHGLGSAVVLAARKHKAAQLRMCARELRGVLEKTK